MKLSCSCLAASSSCIINKEETPLLDFAAQKLEALVWQKGDTLALHLEGQLLLNVFNNIRYGWEPVIDRWHFKLQLEVMRNE